MNDDGAEQLQPRLDEQDQPRITAEPVESLPRRIASGPVLTLLGQYVPMEWAGVNTSGLKPMGDSVLILPDQPKPRTAGGIYLSDQEIERMAYAAETGVIVDAGDGAWAWNADRTRKFDGERPSPGTRIWFERYAGALPHGVDGLIYRLVTDKQIGAIAIGLPDTHEFAEVDGKRIVQRKDQPPVPPVPPMKHTGINDPGAPPPELPGFPRFLKKNGNMLMAFSATDMRDKAPDDTWWPTQAIAEDRAEK